MVVYKPYDIETHLDDLIHHISLVREACIRLGSRLIEQGDDLGRQLIARGHIHDHSKFHGIEWQYLHVGDDIDKDMLKLAIHQHVHTNSHHPEYHGGIQNMPPLDVAEMCCDCLARSQEFGTNIKDWFKEDAVHKYKISTHGKQWKLIQQYLDILLHNSFAKLT
jgi:hypothetical protein